MGRAASGAVRACAAAGLLALSVAPCAAGGGDSFPEELITTSRGLGGSGTSLPGLPDQGPPVLRVLLFDPTKALSSESTVAMADELRTIFRGLEVDLGFSVAADETTVGDSDRPEVPVIVLPTDPLPHRRNRKVLGLVMREQKPTRAIWSFLDSLHWTLGNDPRMPPSGPGADEALGVALGRVVAHEIVHAIAPEEPHAKNGLMNHTLNRTFLLGRQVRLDGRCSKAFLARLAARHAELARQSAPEPTAAIAATH